MSTNTVTQEQLAAAYLGIQTIFRKFAPLFNSRQMLRLRGMRWFSCPDEHGILAARILVELGQRVPPGYEEVDLYGHDDLPGQGSVDIGGIGTPQTPAEYNRLNVHIVDLLERIARDPQAVEKLRELAQEDIDQGVQVLGMLNQIAKYAPDTPQ